MTIEPGTRPAGGDLDELLLSPAFLADPYPVFARFRAESPVHWVDAWNCWLITRGADIDATIRDTRRFKSSDRVTRVIESTPGFSHERLGALHENFRVGMAQTDPPDHTRVRGLVSSAFTPRRVESLRARIQELVDGMIDAVIARGDGRIELVGDLAFPLPAIVISEMAGFPVEDKDRFRDWTWRINQFFFRSGSVDPAHGDDANRAILEARGWIHPLLEERRRDAARRPARRARSRPSTRAAACRRPSCCRRRSRCSSAATRRRPG